MKSRQWQFNPPLVLAVGFLVLIAIGTLLLKLPFATLHHIEWTQAAFTATSAATVTGLAVVNTSEFTLFGQFIIAILIQIGGLGFMVFAIAIALSFRVNMGFHGQLMAQEALGQTSLRRISETTVAVIKYTLFFEVIGMLLLFFIWLPEKSWYEALYAGFFFTIAAFNNAGFSLYDDNLSQYVSNFGVNITIGSLVIIGGLGFWVLLDIHRNKLWRRFNLNTKLVLSTTLIINLVAFFVLWLLERHNPNTIGNFDTGTQLLASWFQAISPRTAGFNTIPIDQMTNASTILMILLMFIGGGSLSTASGLKIGTFAVLCLATYAFLRQQPTISAFQRSISEEHVKKALSLFMITLLFIWVGIFILSIVEPQQLFTDIVFEVVSALGTVGLSRGITSSLTDMGEIIIMIMMFVGRLGPLTITYLITLPRSPKIRYTQEDIQVG